MLDRNFHLRIFNNGPQRIFERDLGRLTGRPIDQEVAEVLAVREPLYRSAATLIVNSDGESPEHVARRIARHLEGTIRQEAPAS